MMLFLIGNDFVIFCVLFKVCCLFKICCFLVNLLIICKDVMLLNFIVVNKLFLFVKLYFLLII